MDVPIWLLVLGVAFLAAGFYSWGYRDGEGDGYDKAVDEDLRTVRAGSHSTR